MNKIESLSFIRYALGKCKQKACEGIQKGENPFGACVIIESNIVSCVHDHAISNNNPADHAEVVSIYTALKKMKVQQFGPGAILVSTCEPCPICVTVAQLSGIERIYFGMSIATGKKRGYLRYSFSSYDTAILLKSNIKIISLENENSTESLIDLWENLNGVNISDTSI